MAKPDLGGKQKCQNCGTKFFDLNKNPIVCPKCGTVQSGAAPTPVRASASRAQAAAPVVEDEETDAETPEIVSLDDADQIDDGKVAAVNPEDEIEADETTNDDDTFLEEEEDEGGNVSDLIDGDIEEDEER